MQSPPWSCSRNELDGATAGRNPVELALEEPPLEHECEHDGRIPTRSNGSVRNFKKSKRLLRSSQKSRGVKSSFWGYRYEERRLRLAPIMTPIRCFRAVSNPALRLRVSKAREPA